VSVIRAEGLNVLDVLRHRHLVLTKPAVQAVERRLDEALRAARPVEQGEPT
jgi:ribosomal protein L4